MRNYAIIIWILTFGFFGCKQEKPNEKIELVKPNPVIQKEGEDNNPIFSKNDYDLVYEYNDEEDDQIIGINIINKKKLKFHLVTKTLPCDTEFWGIAENKNWNSDPEIDEDENGVISRMNISKMKKIILLESDWRQIQVKS